MAEYWQQDVNISQKFTVEEYAQQRMLEQEMRKAETEVAKQERLLGITIKNKIKELAVSPRVMQELGEVAYNKLLHGEELQKFWDYLESTEIAYTENLFNDEIRPNKKQIRQTVNELNKDLQERNKAGLNFYASF